MRFPLLFFWVMSKSLKVNLLAGFVLLGGALASAQIRISQFYGGGGNSSATLRNDFVELYNPGNSPVSLASYSLQYAASTGVSWQVTNLLGSIPADGYYLVTMA